MGWTLILVLISIPRNTKSDNFVKICLGRLSYSARIKTKWQQWQQPSLPRQQGQVQKIPLVLLHRRKTMSVSPVILSNWCRYCNNFTEMVLNSGGRESSERKSTADVNSWTISSRDIVLTQEQLNTLSLQITTMIQRDRCASGCVVECRICNREVAGSNLSLGYCAPRSIQPSIPPGLVNEYQLWLGRQRQIWLIPIADECVGVQVKLWNPFRRRAIPERFCGGDSLRRGVILSVCTFTFTDVLSVKYTSPVQAPGLKEHRLRFSGRMS